MSWKLSWTPVLRPGDHSGRKVTQGETYLEAGDICLTKTLTYAPVCFSYTREAYLEFGDKCIFLFAYFYLKGYMEFGNIG